MKMMIGIVILAVLFIVGLVNYNSLVRFLGEAAFGGDEPMQYETNVRNVTVSGEPFETSYDSETDRCRIRIGDADQTLIGPKSYDLSFTYVIPEDRLDGFDFLYYSVLGAQPATL